MTLFNLLSDRARRDAAETRKARRASRPTLDHLEKREVFTVGLASPIMGPVLPAPSTPVVHASTPTGFTPVTTTGTALGLEWRFVTSDTKGDGTLFVQDVAAKSNSADPKQAPIWINQNSQYVSFDLDMSNPYDGPAVKAGSVVKVIVAETTGDDMVIDDRNPNQGFMTTENRLQTGTISVPYGYLTWTMDSNIVTQKATFSVASGIGDHSVYNINAIYLNPEESPNPTSNPIIGFEVTDNGNDSGGCNFIAGVDPTVTGNITIKTSGGATFKNNTPYA